MYDSQQRGRCEKGASSPHADTRSPRRLKCCCAVALSPAWPVVAASRLEPPPPLPLYARACAGVSRDADLGYFYQTQQLATPQNASDPLLQRWVTGPAPVMPAAPPQGTHAQWRDPTTATWVPVGGPAAAPAGSPSSGGAAAGDCAPCSSSGAYFLAVGAQIDCPGAAGQRCGGRTWPRDCLWQRRQCAPARGRGSCMCCWCNGCIWCGWPVGCRLRCSAQGVPECVGGEGGGGGHPQ